MRSVVPMKTAKIGCIAVSIILMIFGAMLIAEPAKYGNVIGMVIGIAMIVFGAFKIVGYFSKDLFRLAFQYDLAFGILLITLGVITLLRTEDMMEFMTLAIGLAVLADALFKIQISVDAKSFGVGHWWMIFTLAIIAGIIGLTLIFNPGASGLALLRLLGLCIMADGIMSLVTMTTAVKIINHQFSDRIDEMEYKRV
ncbi:MAG: DUF308 domain-containing protein [Lachnospiraceae bacterium]|nr:DUF308 domain-containing protein [Lachnospiraceae bacterium]MBR4994277.1 DUF308 domain-containing protein [Lachnospiraceae bacterium]MBR5944686.1 DUF308 domain-containing protein [Lachnospiraceae bacterium]